MMTSGLVATLAAKGAENSWMVLLAMTVLGKKKATKKMKKEKKVAKTGT